MLDNTDDFEGEAGIELQTESVEQLDRAALRQRVRDFVATNSTSLKSVALITGIAESTFTAWLNDKYKGNNERIDADIRTWLKSEEKLGRRRMAMPADMAFCQTRSSMKIVAAFEHAQALPDVVVAVGGAGIGKTSAINHYRETRPNVWVVTAEPSISSAYAMLEYLREVLGLPETAPHKVSRAVALKIQGTQGLLIIDEAQHLAVKCIDQLRQIFDRAGIGVALVGNEEVWRQVDGGGRKAQFTQLYSRVGMRVTIPRSHPKDVDAILDAAQIVEPKQRAMLRVIAGKGGALRTMVKTLRLARMVAIGASEELSEKHIQAAFARLSGDDVVTP